jgi:hypothetical protein
MLEGGYHHTFDIHGVGHLYNADGGFLENLLKATCQRVARDLRGVGFRKNVIHFYPGDHHYNANMNSGALCYKRLVEYANITMWFMLFRCAAKCITPEILEKVEQKYPHYHFTALYRRALI